MGATAITAIALALRARAILLVLEKFTRAYLFQINCTRNHVITYTNMCCTVLFV